MPYRKAEPAMDDPRPTERFFSPAQYRLFRFTAVLGAAVAMTGLVVLIIWVLGKLITLFYNLLLPLSIAGVMALVLYPVIGWMRRHLHVSHAVAVWLLMLVASMLVLGGVAFVLPSAVDQAVKLWNSVPEIAARINESLSRQFPTVWTMVLERFEEWEPGDMEGLDAEMADRVFYYVGVLFGLAAVPFFLFFALLSGGRLREGAKDFLSIFRPETQREVLYLVEVFVGYVTAFFQGQFIIALIMAGLYSLGFTLIGLNASIAVGVALGALNIVPYLGTIVGLLIVLPLAGMQPDAGNQLVLLVLLVFGLVQLIESWLLTPKIMGDRAGLHPAVVVISLFFWGTALNGVIGMILAVPLTAFLVALWRHMRKREVERLGGNQVELPPAAYAPEGHDDAPPGPPGH